MITLKLKYGKSSRLLFTQKERLIYEFKTEDVCEDFSKDKERFHFSEYSFKSRYYRDSSKLVVGKMKDEGSDFAIKELVGLNPKMCSFVVDDSSDHKKAKSVNKNVVATISHDKYKDVLLNNKSLELIFKRAFFVKL